MKLQSKIALLSGLGLILVSCNNYNPHNIIDVLGRVKDKGKNFIDSEYIYKKPVAQIINMPTHSILEKKFKLKNATNIQIYAVGELIYNLASVRRRYYLLGDDIELYFSTRRNNAQNNKKFYTILSWADGKPHGGVVSFIKDGITLKGFRGLDDYKRGYTAEIKIPWRILIDHRPEMNEKIKFDIAIGDDDDHYKQKAKIALFDKQDIMIETDRQYGTLLLTDFMNKGKKKNVLNSYYNTPKMDGKIDDWYSIPFMNIKNVIMGIVKDKYDLSVEVHSCWDHRNLYLLVKILDANTDYLGSPSTNTKGTFADYGWIEDDKGNIIWKMDVLHSHYAGGALKNQKIDTTIHLAPGEYTLHFISDESHTYHNWDDDPPKTPFYGIVLYKQ